PQIGGPSTYREREYPPASSYWAQSRQRSCRAQFCRSREWKLGCFPFCMSIETKRQNSAAGFPEIGQPRTFTFFNIIISVSAEMIIFGRLYAPRPDRAMLMNEASRLASFVGPIKLRIC